EAASGCAGLEPSPRRTRLGGLPAITRPGRVPASCTRPPEPAAMARCGAAVVRRNTPATAGPAGPGSPAPARRAPYRVPSRCSRQGRPALRNPVKTPPAGRLGEDFQSELFLQRARDHAPHGVPLPAHGNGHLLDRRTFRSLQQADDLSLFRSGPRTGRPWCRGFGRDRQVPERGPETPRCRLAVLELG